MVPLSKYRLPGEAMDRARANIDTWYDCDARLLLSGIVLETPVRASLRRRVLFRACHRMKEHHGQNVS